MTVATSLIDRGTCIEWDSDGGRWVPDRGTQRQESDGGTSTDPLEHFEIDVDRLGKPIRQTNGEDRRQRAKGIAASISQSKNPYRRIKIVVDHCCARASQDKIDDGAFALSQVPEWLVRFVDLKDDGCFSKDGPVARYQRVWLYSIAFSWAQKDATWSTRIRILCTWLGDKDAGIRESAANALGFMRASEAVSDLQKALKMEANTAVKEAIEDALQEVASE